MKDEGGGDVTFVHPVILEWFPGLWSVESILLINLMCPLKITCF